MKSLCNIIFIILMSNLYLLPAEYIDVNYPYYKTLLSSDDKLFGFSVNVFQNQANTKKMFLIGSPKETLANSVNNSGALYNCPISAKYDDCIRIPFNEYKEDSLLGYTVDSSITDDVIYTCAPRFMMTISNILYPSGMCWQINEDLKQMTEISNPKCREYIKKNRFDTEMRNCLTGAALSGLDNKIVLVTSPYMMVGRGELMLSRHNQALDYQDNSNTLSLKEFTGDYQLTGSSMSVSKIDKLTSNYNVVLGGPSLAGTDNDTSDVGQSLIMMVTLTSSNQMAMTRIIRSTTFGDGFGYSVLLMDLNGDGIDELVVGAPYSDNNRGCIHIFWSGVDKHIICNDAKLADGDWGQFGNSLENIGDINDDKISDLAVGAPFYNKGSGAVFIYLGNKKKLVTLSQKLEASKMGPNIKGFGFSIFGRGIDLDDNKYTDLVVGAPISNQVFGFRARPLIKIYSSKLLNSDDYQISYDFNSMSKCGLEEGENLLHLPCISVNVKLAYYYTKSKCTSTDSKKKVTWELKLDQTFYNITRQKRVYFKDKTLILTNEIDMSCKDVQNTFSNPGQNVLIYFPSQDFFNFSTPIPLELYIKRFSIPEVPKRNIQNPIDQMVNMQDYPTTDSDRAPLTKCQISFGAGCTRDTCRPILQMMTSTTLRKEHNEYNLFIESQSKFNISIEMKNLAGESLNMAFNTYIRVKYDVKHIKAVFIGPGKHQVNPTGLVYGVKSPLKALESENSEFIFELNKDFLQSGQEYLHVNVSVETMYPQIHLKPKSFKIRIKMVADIDLKVTLQPETNSFQAAPILGFNAIKSEEKIGPKVKMMVTLMSKEKASVVVSSKLVIFFPWEIAGNVNERNGQFMLYLLRQPLYKVSATKRNITCNKASLEKLVNVINTRIHNTAATSDEQSMKPVTLAYVPLPKNMPKFENLTSKLVFSNLHEKPKTDWEKTVLISCRNGSGRCVPIVCDLGPLSRQSGEISIQLEFRIWLYTLIEKFLNYKYVHVDIPIYWIPDVNYDIILKKANTDSAYTDAKITAFNLQKPKSEPSNFYFIAIVVSICCGILVLAIIVVILYKCQFFRRKRLFRNGKTLR